ncbi:MAG: hypothetical protein R3B72_28810 [Polyangiaceae bacterium]
MVDEASIRIVGGAIQGSAGSVLSELDFVASPGSVVALLGPAGSGKSTFLRRLAGGELGDGWSTAGTWEAQAEGGLCWLPQRAHRHATPATEAPPGIRVDDWETAFANARVVLLDEPLVDRPSEEAALIAALKAHSARGGTSLVVTHKVSFARAAADQVWFVGGGMSRWSGSAAAFFGDPAPSPEAAQFIRTGSCSWSVPRRIELPSHFYWIVEGRIAGMGRPGLSRDADEDLASISEAGVKMLVSLTKQPIPHLQLSSHGLRGRHFFIPDMGVPSTRDLAGLCGDLERRVAAGEPAALHCHAGLGRTGTVLACMLCWVGMAPDEAIVWVRERGRKACIQTEGQERFVHTFATDYRPSRVTADWLK